VTGPEPVGQSASIRLVERRRRVREAGLGYVLVLPSLVLFAAFVFYPFIHTLYLGFYRTPPFPGLPRHYVGLAQYRSVLRSGAFTSSIATTLAFAAMTVPASLVLGTALALLAHARLRGIGVYRTIFSSTVATSVAVASVIFGTLLNPVVGFLPWLGLQTAPPILENPSWALVAVAVTSVWQSAGLAFILISSGLQSIPDDLLEAAQVDGANSWTRLWRVTLPMLTPTLFFTVVVGSIVAFQAFGQIDLLTQGGPIHRTNVLTYAIYTAIRQDNDEGRAAVLTAALFAITLVLTLIQVRVLERRVHYGR